MANPPAVVVLGTITYSLVVTLLILSWLAVSLRLWVRLRITKSPGWDDWTMLLTLFLFTCYCAFILVITLGAKASRQFTAKEVLQSITYIQLGEVFYILTTTALKISLGLFFLRLVTKRWQRNLFHTILAISAFYGLLYFFVAIFQCGNPAKLAENLLASKNCAPSWFLLFTGYLYGIVNVVADWTFTLIPILILIDSDMDRRSKISVGVVIGLAAIGSVASIARMVFLKGLLFQKTISTDSIKATIWATAEPGTGIVAASGAILRPLFRQLTSDIRSRVSEYGSGKSRSNKSVRKDTVTGDSESIIGLTSVAAKKNSVYSPHNEEPWDDTVSVERAQFGRIVTIKAMTGEIRPPVPAKDRKGRF